MSAGNLLLLPHSAQALDIAAGLPWELLGILSVLRTACEVLVLLGSATMVLQAITLGASMLGSKSGTHALRTCAQYGGSCQVR